MDFSDPPRPRRQENLLPMINVVFLLLIFFLISARMTPPEPFDITPPEAATDAAITEAEEQGQFTLFIAADARLGYRDALDDQALTALAAARSRHCTARDCTATPPRLTLRADSALSAQRLAQILPDLAQLGFAEIDLVARAGASAP